jgi:hypothetical protein
MVCAIQQTVDRLPTRARVRQRSALDLCVLTSLVLTIFAQGNR